ncbi:hypothetical protein SVIO_008420 [Streptomyces violaceusniger]|uniref:Integrase catalytic domain-containing protein n=1 Tax=Streptomyces violaceusniger TaxID=68280 RepID=A0A4D4KWJ8_STRVO|nr:hypothetical protein SVIO_008420 [Streptomyces violaceusniger]
MHGDLVSRNFIAASPNRLWLADITEHATGQGKLYLCALKDVFSNRIVGYSIDARTKSRLAVAALDNAVARREHVDGCILHSDRGSIPVPEVRPDRRPSRRTRPAARSPASAPHQSDSGSAFVIQQSDRVRKRLGPAHADATVFLSALREYADL